MLNNICKNFGIIPDRRKHTVTVSSIINIIIITIVLVSTSDLVCKWHSYENPLKTVKIR